MEVTRILTNQNMFYKYNIILLLLNLNSNLKSYTTTKFHALERLVIGQNCIMAGYTGDEFTKKCPESNNPHIPNYLFSNSMFQFNQMFIKSLHKTNFEGSV